MAKQKKETPWSKLNKDQKVARLSDLWTEGLSDNEIAKLLSATKGQIVGFRHTHTDLTAENRGVLAGGQSEAVMPGSSAHTKQAPPTAEPDQASKPPPRSSTPQQQRSAATEVRSTPAARRRFAVSEKDQCDHIHKDDQKQCGYVATVQIGEKKYCSEHARSHR